MKVKEILREAWSEEAHINPEKRGMFNGRSLASLEAELAHLKSTGPHHEGSPEFTKERELQFAIRAKHNWSGGEENEEWGVHHTGQNTNKSVAELRHELANAHKSGNTKEMRQKEFAIRAKTHW